jgi:hypothetical protein
LEGADLARILIALAGATYITGFLMLVPWGSTFLGYGLSELLVGIAVSYSSLYIAGENSSRARTVNWLVIISVIAGALLPTVGGLNLGSTVFFLEPSLLNPTFLGFALALSGWVIALAGRIRPR